MNYLCGICGERAALWKVVDEIDFVDCSVCGSIAMTAENLALVDADKFERKYDESYWEEEATAAKERSYGPALARAAEAILLSRRPVERFIDVGTGTGSLLDSLSYQLPSSSHRFFGVERFPPKVHSTHSGYTVGTLGKMRQSFDCGVCIEVIEHLTPLMLKQLARELSWVSRPNTFLVFNTGLSNYVRTECPTYIDPRHRGHIVSWGFRALVDIFGGEGFKVHRLGNREWAFAVEYLPDGEVPLSNRIWSPLDANRDILQDPKTGMLMYLIARDSLRCEGL